MLGRLRCLFGDHDFKETIDQYEDEYDIRYLRYTECTRCGTQGLHYQRKHNKKPRVF